jgi:hypothetical protein
MLTTPNYIIYKEAMNPENKDHYKIAATNELVALMITDGFFLKLLT